MHCEICAHVVLEGLKDDIAPQPQECGAPIRELQSFTLVNA